MQTFTPSLLKICSSIRMSMSMLVSKIAGILSLIRGASVGLQIVTVFTDEMLNCPNNVILITKHIYFNSLLRVLDFIGINCFL